MTERRAKARPPIPTLEQQFVRAVKRRLDMGFTPDQAINCFVFDYNRGCIRDSDRVNMAQIFDIFTREEGMTIYEFAEMRVVA